MNQSFVVVPDIVSESDVLLLSLSFVSLTVLLVHYFYGFMQLLNNHKNIY